MPQTDTQIERQTHTHTHIHTYTHTHTHTHTHKHTYTHSVATFPFRSSHHHHYDSKKALQTCAIILVPRMEHLVCILTNKGVTLHRKTQLEKDENRNGKMKERDWDTGKNKLITQMRFPFCSPTSLIIDNWATPVQWRGTGRVQEGG